jgi:hypothetical protein
MIHVRHLSLSPEADKSSTHILVVHFSVWFNIFLPPTPRSFKWSLSFRCAHQSPVPHTWQIGTSHPILVKLSTGTICGEKYKLWSSSFYSLCITTSLLGPHLSIQHVLCISECPYALFSLVLTSVPIGTAYIF